MQHCPALAPNTIKLYIGYMVPLLSSLEAQDLFLCHYIDSMFTTLDISSNLLVFMFQCIFQSKSKVLFDKIFRQIEARFFLTFELT